MRVTIKSKEQIISKIMEIEWLMFTSVRNRGGRASCQEDPETFRLIRTSTFNTWSEATLESYLDDLTRAKEAGRNLMTEKYARMEGMGRPLDSEVNALIEKIVEYEIGWAEELTEKYPDAKLARPIYSSQDSHYIVSSETYSRGELATYSRKTLELYLNDIQDLISKDLNRIELAIGIMLRKSAQKS